MEGILPILSSLAQQVHFSINLQSSMGAPDWAAFHVSAQDKLLTCPRQTPFLSMTFKRSPWSSLNELEDDERKEVSLMRQLLLHICPHCPFQNSVNHMTSHVGRRLGNMICLPVWEDEEIGFVSISVFPMLSGQKLQENRQTFTSIRKFQQDQMLKVGYLHNR